jgi:hypothetical protein
MTPNQREVFSDRTYVRERVQSCAHFARVVIFDNEA